MAEPGTHLGFLTFCTFLHLFLGPPPKTSSLFLLFFCTRLSLSSPQASFLFCFLFFSLSWGAPANLSIPQWY